MEGRVTLCALRRDPAKDAAEFEESVLRNVFPDAGDGPRAESTLFIRSLLSSDAEPSAYLCTVEASSASDSRFYGMRDPLIGLGAHVDPPRYWQPVASLPGEEAARRTEEVSAHTNTMLTLLMPVERDNNAFEKVLGEVLAELVAIPETRGGGVMSARWYRADSTSQGGATDYLCRITSYGAAVDAWKTSLKRLQDSGAQLLQSQDYRFIGSVAGGSVSPELA